MNAIFVFLFGLLLGSFANVCIYRLPKEKSVIRPRSYCPNCNKTIAWFDNIPVLSFITLKGRCRNCKQKISLRYPLVELITAVLFLLLFLKFGFSINFFSYSLLSLGLIIATFIDFEYRIIPFEITVTEIILGVILSLVFPRMHNSSAHLIGLLKSCLGLLAGGGIIYLTGFIFDLVYFRLLKKPPIEGETESMGGGDVMLMAMAGAFLGWQRVLLVFFLAPFFGAVVGIYSLISKKTHLIAYGPYLSLATIIVIFFYQYITRFLFGV